MTAITNRLPTAMVINDNDVAKLDQTIIEIPGDPKRFVQLVSLGILKGGLEVLRQFVHPPPQDSGLPLDRDVMTADEVAAFLGVDRNTVYEYAGRGDIPHRRLGKRMIFRRGAIVAWLDAAKASSGR